jgi:hypothetical protein
VSLQAHHFNFVNSLHKNGAASTVESQLSFASSPSQTKNQKKFKKLHDEVKVEKFCDFNFETFRRFVCFLMISLACATTGFTFDLECSKLEQLWWTKGKLICTVDAENLTNTDRGAVMNPSPYDDNDAITMF